MVLFRVIEPETWIFSANLPPSAGLPDAEAEGYNPIIGAVTRNYIPVGIYDGKKYAKAIGNGNEGPDGKKEPG